MANIYLALNGDDVGTRIGEAIANDDHEGLASASSDIEGAHGNIDQWVESVGGKKVTRSGDEGIYLIPEEALGDLESIKSSYKEQSGHGLTIGVGSSMSEASKALIYGKLNGKDQVVHYDPSIEDYLSEEDVSENEMPEDSEEDESDDLDSGEAHEAAKEPSSPSVEADGNPDEADGEDDQEDEEQAEQESDDEGFAENEDVGDPDDGHQDSAEDEEEDQEAEGYTPPESEDEESQAAPGDDLADDNQKVTESPKSTPPPQVSDEEDSEDPDAPNSEAIDGDVDGEDFGADKDGSEEAEQDEEMASNTPAPEMDASAEQPPGQEAQSTYQELNDDDMENPDMEMDNESYDQNDALTGMIHGDMNDEGEDEESAEEGSSQLDDELRQDIASALMAFKENKEMLEQAREQNPKLYDATITMLRSMIEMAKKLGQNPEQDIQDQEGQQQLNEEFPEAGGEEGDEQMSAAAPMQNEEDEEAPPEKK